MSETLGRNDREGILRDSVCAVLADRDHAMQSGGAAHEEGVSGEARTPAMPGGVPLNQQYMALVKEAQELTQRLNKVENELTVKLKRAEMAHNDALIREELLKRKIYSLAGALRLMSETL